MEYGGRFSNYDVSLTDMALYRNVFITRGPTEKEEKIENDRLFNTLSKGKEGWINPVIIFEPFDNDLVQRFRRMLMNLVIEWFCFNGFSNVSVYLLEPLDREDSFLQMQAEHYQTKKEGMISIHFKKEIAFVLIKKQWIPGTPESEKSNEKDRSDNPYDDGYGDGYFDSDDL